ncbi:HAMP domain-containing protein [Bacillus mangrovi]|uniref:HAMP domain-containing protein n=1 Tax=Metabacillus mangrovi TaxID=1491830 RepID=A0A7X2S7A2_9BACI|nr:sensor histidine kinase [Metabacillus mangrovi]MTH54979.1 HAMP domain-containing protein [Metabacillus mangrovi]
MIKWLKHLSIKRKIMLLALFSAFLPLIVIGPFTFLYFSKIVENQATAAAGNLLNTADRNLNTFAGDIEDISNLIFLSNDIEGYLTYRKKDARLYQLETSSMDTLSSITVVNKPYINAIFIGNGMHSFVKVNRGERLLPENAYELIRRSSLYPRLLNSRWEGEWFYGDDTSLTPGSEYPLLYGRMIRSLGTSEQIGMLLISMDDSVFRTMFGSMPGSMMVMDSRTKEPIYSQGPDAVLQDAGVANTAGLSGQEGYKVKEIGGVTYMLNYHTNAKTGWTMVSILPYEELIREVNNVRLITISLLAFSLLLSVLIAVLITKRITNQLEMLRHATKKMEKREPLHEHAFDRNDEIGRIGGRFVELYNRNQELTAELYRAEVKEKEAELRALQSHINPHFLYNTLNSIYWMAEKSKAGKIAKMAISLSKIFKLTLNNGEPITTVQKELEQVESYLLIQNIRFDGRISYSIQVEEELLQEEIIKLLLQPIVENAVYHGFEPETGEGKIEITGKREGEGFLFTVKDDGKGFVPGEASGGYALKNIHERLTLHYGEAYGLTIHSEPGRGTTVTLKAGIRPANEKGA